MELKRKKKKISAFDIAVNAVTLSSDLSGFLFDQ